MNKIFKHTFPLPNLHNSWKCPLCLEDGLRPVILVPILGSEKNGLVKARQIHADCFEFGMAGVLKEGPSPAMLKAKSLEGYLTDTMNLDYNGEKVWEILEKVDGKLYWAIRHAIG